MLHVVLIEPEIPWNTGNIGRTCLGAGAELHLVGRLGFHLDEKELQRAGLDYWEKINPQRYATWDVFLEKLDPLLPMMFLSTKGTRTYWDADFSKGAYLIFGKETAGLPKDFYDIYKDKMYKIPQADESIRSLNLSTAVGIVLYEAVRQNLFQVQLD